MEYTSDQKVKSNFLRLFTKILSSPQNKNNNQDIYSIAPSKTCWTLLKWKTDEHYRFPSFKLNVLSIIDFFLNCLPENSAVIFKKWSISLTGNTVSPN